MLPKMILTRDTANPVHNSPRVSHLMTTSQCNQRYEDGPCYRVEDDDHGQREVEAGVVDCTGKKEKSTDY